MGPRVHEDVICSEVFVRSVPRNIKKQIVQQTAVITELSRKKQWARALWHFKEVQRQFPAAVDDICRGATLHAAALGAQWQEAR
eukprot:symbB.v1.2.022619.t1/scaffold2019.1/size92256/1